MCIVHSRPPACGSNGGAQWAALTVTESSSSRNTPTPTPSSPQALLQPNAAPPTLCSQSSPPPVPFPGRGPFARHYSLKSHIQSRTGTGGTGLGVPTEVPTEAPTSQACEFPACWRARWPASFTRDGAQAGPFGVQCPAPGRSFPTSKSLCWASGQARLRHCPPAAPLALLPGESNLPRPLCCSERPLLARTTVLFFSVP